MRGSILLRACLVLDLAILASSFVIPGFNSNPTTFTDETDALFDKKPAPMFSFRAPFYLVRGTIPFWTFGGTTVVTEEYVRLTPDQKSSSGYIWSQKPSNFANWEVELDISISGSLSVGADGMAFWYIAQETPSLGPTYGGPERWSGLAVTVDTFDNDQKGDNPSISILLNDNSWAFNAADDGGPRAAASCKQFLRNSPSALKIQYYDNSVYVFVKIGKSDSWRPCAKAEAKLPSGYYFGVTAATGGLADNHDVTSFTTKRLLPLGQKEEKFPKDQPKVPKVEDNREGTKAKELAEKLSNAKKVATPAASPQVEQKPLPSPPVPRAVPASDGTVQGEVRRLNQQYQNLGDNLEFFKQQVQALEAKEAQDAQYLQRMVDQQAVFLEALAHLKRNPPGGLTDAGLSERLEEFRRQTDQIRDMIVSKLDQKNVEINNLIGELQRSLNIAKGTAAAAKQDQENIQRDLAKQQQALAEHVETSSGFGVWTYVLVLQLVGGFGYMYYRKIRDDRNKKFY